MESLQITQRETNLMVENLGKTSGVTNARIQEYRIQETEYKK